MKYVDCDGVPRSGEVWSAGPVANSVWLRDFESGRWHVVDIKSRKQVPYQMPVFMRPLPPEQIERAREVIVSRRLNPLPADKDWIICDPELDAARAIWTLAIQQDKTTSAIHATRYADRASVSAKRLMELEKEQ